jgi:hypothetical protein
MNRHLKAFLMGPLVAPGLLFLILIPDLRTSPIIGRALMIAIIVSYTGAFLLGAPAYAAQRSLGWTALWISLLVGSVAAVILFLIVLPVFFFLMNPIGNFSDQFFALLRRTSYSSIGLMAMWGALVSGVVWAIGRPDRP